jgi:hypothetical protein
MVLISIFLAVNIILPVGEDVNRVTIVNARSKVKTEVFNESLEIKEAFYKIAKRKYDEKKCNCKHKSEAFAEVLTHKGLKMSKYLQ